MRNILYIILVTLIISCNSDDSSSVPIGMLTKVEVYYPQTELRTEFTSSFNSRGKIISTHGKSISSGDDVQYTTTFSYNSNGQIWKSTTVFDGDSIDYTEFTFNNGLITSSTRYSNSGNVFRSLYSYNDDNQLIHKQHFNAEDELAATTDITFFANGNIENTYFDDFDGDFKSYTYEYDTNNNPQMTHFGDQELSKVVGNNFNNATRNIYARNGGSSEITIEYTYNEAGYPITSNEFSGGGTLTTQVNYTYQE